ncbi:DUF397 domain-containing protein [Streptomyces scabiei]|uniref:DUF397 domain-containing protein n=1 Tax=Streptomyces scabiei TaxID=1930 RepID=UPI0029B7A35D|nr:DUF397 domain-containing protein [Streptomyces scabiei]MDX2802321.1 DUF397 domain-containing protein [Streptomyces scabiei]MDX3277242.1 DUF397 domain-containing protein [Streptomyces scabiei]
MADTAVLRASDLPGAAWYKSSYSGADQSTCVEVADVRTTLGRIAVRDSKDPTGPVLLFTADQFAALVANTRAYADKID